MLRHPRNLVLIFSFSLTTIGTLNAQRIATTVGVGSQPVAVAVNPVTNKIYSVNAGDNSVTVIDGATYSTTTISVGNLMLDPGVISVNPVTNKIYVANYSDNTVTIIDGATNTTSTVGVGSQPVAVAVNSVTNKIYVANQSSSNVTVIDGVTGNTTMVGVGSFPFAVAVNSVTNRIYVANDGSSTVTVIDGSTNNTTTVGGGSNMWAVGIDAVSNDIYVTNQWSNSVTAFDGQSSGVIATIAASSPYGLAINPATNKIYVINWQGTYANSNGSITVIDGATNTTSMVSVGIAPQSIAVNPSTNRIYVANNSSKDVTVIDGATNNTSSISIGANCYSGIYCFESSAVAVDSQTDRIYVANRGANSVTVIDGSVVTVAANNASRSYGAVNPALTYMMSGFENGDTQASATSGAPALMTTAVAASSPGTYPISIVLGTLAAANYTFNLVNGNLTVIQAGSSVTLTSSNSTVVSGSPVTFTAVALPATSGIPSGTILFYDGTVLLGGAPLSNGMATYTTSTLTVGTHEIIAQYSGDADFGGSTSSSLAQTETSPLPSMVASPLSLTFAYQTGTGASVQQQSVSVASTGSPISYSVAVCSASASLAQCPQAAFSVSWLSATQANGLTPSNVTAIVAHGLPAGVYSGQIVLYAPGALNSSVRVPVTLTVIGGPLARLVFPVKQDTTHCSGGGCTPYTASIETVFDHAMTTAYENKYRMLKGACSPKPVTPPGYGTLVDFENERASSTASQDGYALCQGLHGYTNAMGSTFLPGFNYNNSNAFDSNHYLYYDGHPGYDYPSNYGTPLYPAVSGCVSYRLSSANASPVSDYHTLAIIPQSAEPHGGCEQLTKGRTTYPASETGYVVFYLHLASYLDNGRIVYCSIPKSGSSTCSKKVVCTNCPPEGTWVSADSAQPIAYVGDFDKTWGGVGSHLHFEVDHEPIPSETVTPTPLDPYGWWSSASDPYTSYAGMINTWLWK